MPKFGGYDFALCGNLLVDQVYQGVPMYRAHYRGGDYQDTPGGVVLCLWDAQGDQLRWGRTSTLRYWLVQEGPEIPQCPGVYGDSLLAHEQPPM